MANTKSSQKSARQNEKHRVRNNARRSALKTAMRRINICIATSKETGQAQTLLKDVAAKLARAKSKGIIHKNAASRKLSRLAKRIARTIQTTTVEEVKSI